MIAAHPQQPLEPVCQFRAVCSLIGELAHEQRERLGVTGDPQRSGVHRIEADVADQSAATISLLLASSPQ